MNTPLWYQLCKYTSVLILIACLSIVGSSVADLCTPLDEQSILSGLREGVVPLGAADAGTFTRDEAVQTLAECVASCCASENCEVMFYFQNACLLIACNQSWPSGCDPLPSDDGRITSAFMLRVRSADEIRSSMDSASSTDESTDCRVDGCPKHELCEVSSPAARRYECRCKNGYARASNSSTCHKLQSMNTARTVAPLEAPTVNSSNSTFTTVALNFTDEVSVINTTVGTPAITSIRPTMLSTTQVSASLYPVKTLIVSAGENHEIQLPADSITLFAFVLSQPDDAEKDTSKYSYQWSLFAHPEGDETGEMQNINSAALKLSKLHVGLYTFKVTVSTDGKYGEAYVNVTVIPPSRINEAPVAIAKPSTQEVNQPNDLVIDGSGSTDDDKIVSYHWEMVSGKLGSQTSIDASDLDKQMLVLKGLAPGSYKFKLLVTDSDGAQNSTFADATVIKETDYPPTANAGSNVIVSLPVNSVTLFGNASTDDKGIVGYEWTKTSDDKLAVDMVGVRTAFLRLDNLVKGDYIFRLKVTDASGQESTADVRVFVKPEHNQAPTAVAGIDRTVWLPVESVTLDGGNSTDDQKIDSYQWIMLTGPSTVPIENADRAVATASKLSVGEYKFKLTVKDNEGLADSHVITVTVKQNDNQPPIANAGGAQTIFLPATLVILNGSKSTDDRGIVSYRWSRDMSSPAAGLVVFNSDEKPIMQLVNLVVGRYTFKLEVTDEGGLVSSDTATINVKPEWHQLDLVQLILSVEVSTFTESNKQNLESELKLLLRHSLQPGEPKVITESVTAGASSGQTLFTFYVVDEVGKQQIVRPGLDVVSLLKKKLRSSPDVLDYRFVGLETVVCQNNCSGHGQCNQATKRCVCSGFWTENIFRAYFGELESNCDWSILYVIIVLFLGLLGAILIMWGIVCVCRRCTRWKPKVKRHRYTLLEDIEGSEKPLSNGKLEMLQTNKVQGGSSLMESESDGSSEETIFVNHRKPNGSVLNNNTIGSQRKSSNGGSRSVPKA